MDNDRARRYSVDMNGQLIKAVIFDMDGVITDTEPLHVEAERQVCREYGLDAPFDLWSGFKGKTTDDIFSRLVAEFGGGRPLSVPELVARKTAIYLELAARGMPIIPDVVDFIRFVRGRFAKVGLATGSNRPIQQAVFDQLGLHPYFDAVTTAEDVVHGKPDPEVYLKAAECLRVPPPACIVIEDSDNGIRAAKAAGCRVVGITTSFPRERLLAVGADIIVDSYDELKGGMDAVGRR